MGVPMSDAKPCECCGRPIEPRGHLDCGPRITADDLKDAIASAKRERAEMAATDREIVRVVREWWASDCRLSSDVHGRLTELLTKEGEGTR